KRFPVGGNAADIAKMLQDYYKNVSSVRIAPLGNTEIMVWAPNADLLDISDKINDMAGLGQVKLIRVTTVDPDKLADQLKDMFGDAKQQGAAGVPYIASAPTHESILVRGTKEQIAEVEATVKVLDNPTGGAGTMRIINLDRGSGAAVAEEIKNVLEKMGKDV